MSKNVIKKLVEKHKDLIHSENLKVSSHVQREHDEWLINTIMIENIAVPFKYKRRKKYQSLAGNLVNMTYYPATENIAGMEIEVMNVVRIKVA
ncbi:hypothetical protein [Thalassotalea profundi]|uniref:Uncharacterized protein n=1 Tax=Thalassotalea profundi TaxID=2036687 RepID=A0ABQ3ILN0_9GAMM|nr:hypothetical protein [Thalassotalea profundi]GHE85653.1 hypothetical protein GCM10011501_13430 [Thalassotalea profundi]